LQIYRGIQYIKYTPKRYYNIFGRRFVGHGFSGNGLGTGYDMTRDDVFATSQYQHKNKPTVNSLPITIAMPL
jgi:hypothetical protein